MVKRDCKYYHTIDHNLRYRKYIEIEKPFDTPRPNKVLVTEPFSVVDNDGFQGLVNTLQPCTLKQKPPRSRVHFNYCSCYDQQLENESFFPAVLFVLHTGEYIAEVLKTTVFESELGNINNNHHGTVVVKENAQNMDEVVREAGAVLPHLVFCTCFKPYISGRFECHTLWCWQTNKENAKLAKYKMVTDLVTGHK